MFIGWGWLKEKWPEIVVILVGAWGVAVLIALTVLETEVKEYCIAEYADIIKRAACIEVGIIERVE